MKKGSALLATCALGLATLAVKSGPLFAVLGAPTTSQSYTASTYAWSLAQQDAGYIKSCSGGDPLAGGQFSDLDVHLPLPIARQGASGMWLWGATNGTPQTRDGAVYTLNFNQKVTAELDFHGARVREIDFPALDASSRDPGVLSVKIAVPSATRQVFSTPANPATAVTTTAQKMWLAANFRVALDGLPTTRVAKVSAFVLTPPAPIAATVTLKSATLGVAPKVVTLAPPPSDPTDVTLTVSSADLAPYQAWATSVLTQGHTTDTKNGSITLLDSDMQTTVQTITFGTISLKAITVGSGTFTVQLHVANVTLQ